MAKNQPSGDGGEGIKNPVSFDTVEEAMVHAQQIAERDAMIAAMTPQERAEYFNMIANSLPEDIE